MKRRTLALALIVALSLVACAPRATPAPATPTLPPTSSAAPAATAPKVSPEDAEWQKVVQAAQKEGKVTVYTWGYIGDTSTQIRNAFKARYNVDVDLVTGRGAEFTERLKTERRVGQFVADLVQGASVHLLNMKSLDLLDVAPQLPVLRNKGDFRIDPVLDKEGYLINDNVQLIGPMINTNQVKPGEEPKSWKDMLDPKWKGKMLAHSPLISTGLYIEFVPLMNSNSITLDLVRSLGKQDLVFSKGDQESADRLSRGEFPMAMILADTMAGSYVQQGAPIKAIPMNEGVVGTTLDISLVKNAPHPNAARLFLNWIASTEGQTVYHKSKSTASVRKDVPDYRPQGVTLPPTAKIVLETPSDAAEEAQKYSDRWLPDLWK